MALMMFDEAGAQKYVDNFPSLFKALTHERFTLLGYSETSETLSLLQTNEKKIRSATFEFVLALSFSKPDPNRLSEYLETLEYLDQHRKDIAELINFRKNLLETLPNSELTYE